MSWLIRRLTAFRSHHFTQLMGQDKGRFVLHIQIAGELQRRMTLGAVAEDHNGQEVVAERELVIGGDFATGHAE